MNTGKLRPPTDIVWWALAVVPPIALLLVILSYRTDLVILDEFRHVLPRIRNLLEGDFSLNRDLWKNMSVHRSVVPLLFIMANARFAGWNMLYETLAGFAAYVALFAVIVFQLRRTCRALDVDPVNWAIPVVSFLLFSLTSWKVFYMGFAALQHGFVIAGAISGLILLSQQGRTWLRITLAALLGLSATLSFGNGLVFWPVGLLVVLAQKSPRRWPKAVVWTVLSVAVISLYQWDLVYPERIAYFGFTRFKSIVFTLVYLGAPLCNYNTTGAALVGLMGVSAFGALIWILARRERVGPELLIPYVALGLYAIGNAYLTSMGRTFYGVASPLERDWKIVATPLWISVFVLLYLLTAVRARHAGERTVGRPMQKAVAGLVALAAASLSFSIYTEVPRYQYRHGRFGPLEARLLKDPGMESIKPIKLWILHNKVGLAEVLERVHFLRRNRLSVFRECCAAEEESRVAAPAAG